MGRLREGSQLELEVAVSELFISVRIRFTNDTMIISVLIESLRVVLGVKRWLIENSESKFLLPLRGVDTVKGMF